MQVANNLKKRIKVNSTQLTPPSRCTVVPFSQTGNFKTNPTWSGIFLSDHLGFAAGAFPSTLAPCAGSQTASNPASAPTRRFVFYRGCKAPCTLDILGVSPRSCCSSCGRFYSLILDPRIFRNILYTPPVFPVEVGNGQVPYPSW